MLIQGGPQPPDYSGMMKVEKDMAKDAFEKKRKLWTDKLHRSCLKKKVHLDSIQVDNYTICLHPTLQQMADVERERLRVGHAFPDINILKLHVAEEANLQGITSFTPRSKVRQLRCYGKKFAVEANNTEHTEGFLGSVCSVWEGDDFATLNLDKYNNAKEREQMPFKTVMIVPLIIRIVAENAAVTNKTLRGYLKSYGRDYALTELVLNKACCSARVELFGTPESNVKYADNIQEELRKRGHIVQMKYSNRRETLENIERLVISEEMLRRKHADNSTMSANDRKAFIDKWKANNVELLRKQLRPKDVDVVQFLHGIFFTP
jgi:hypothetical protein